jgi:hypothetical protein
MAAGEFPRKISLGAGRIGWVESEIHAWLKLKADARGHEKSTDRLTEKGKVNERYSCRTGR